MAKKTKISRQISKKPASVKKAITSDLGVTLSNSEAVILTEYRGLTVPQMGEIRTKLRELGDGDFSVVKNTLMRIALKEQGIDDERVDILLNGTTAATIASSDPIGVAKVVVDYIAANRNTPLKIKGGVVGGRYFGAEQIDALARFHRVMFSFHRCLVRSTHQSPASCTRCKGLSRILFIRSRLSKTRKPPRNCIVVRTPH